MVAAFDFCATAGAARRRRSTPRCTASSTAPHVDHLHPDSGIAIATAADGEQLTKDIFGDRGRVGAVAASRLPARSRHRRDPRRPSRRRRRDPRRPRHHGMGRDERRGGSELALDHRDRAGVPRHARRRRAVRRRRRRPRRRFRRPSGGRRRRPSRRTCARSRRATTAWSVTSPTRDVVLEFLAGEKLFALAALGTSCPDHFLRTKVKPLVLDLPAHAPLDECVDRLARAARAVPRRLPRLLRAARRRLVARSCGAPTRRSSSCPASGCSRTAGTSRPHESPASSTSTRST